LFHENEMFFLTDRSESFVLKMKEAAIETARNDGTFGPYIVVCGAEGGAYSTAEGDFLRDAGPPPPPEPEAPKEEEVEEVEDDPPVVVQPAGKLQELRAQGPPAIGEWIEPDEENSEAQNQLKAAFPDAIMLNLDFRQPLAAQNQGAADRLPVKPGFPDIIIDIDGLLDRRSRNLGETDRDLKIDKDGSV
jgi:hypothetical protein